MFADGGGANFFPGYGPGDNVGYPANGVFVDLRWLEYNRARADLAILLLEDNPDTASMARLDIGYDFSAEWYEDRFLTLFGYPGMPIGDGHAQARYMSFGGFGGFQDSDIAYFCNPTAAGMSGGPVLAVGSDTYAANAVHFVLSGRYGGGPANHDASGVRFDYFKAHVVLDVICDTWSSFAEPIPAC